MQSFLARVAPLVAAVEEWNRAEAAVLSDPSTRWFSSVEASAGRPFYFDGRQRLVTWQRPPAEEEVRALDSAEVNTETAGDAPTSPSAPPGDGVAGAWKAMEAALAALKAAARTADVSEVAHLAALQREADIRREDWEAGAISDAYALTKMRQLTERVERRLRMRPTASALPTSEGSPEAALVSASSAVRWLSASLSWPSTGR